MRGCAWQRCIALQRYTGVLLPPFLQGLQCSHLPLLLLPLGVH